MKSSEDKCHFKIFRVEIDKKSGKEHKITMKKFWAKDFSEALKVLKDYRSIANKEYTYFIDTTGYYVQKDPITGVELHFDDLEEMREMWAKKYRKNIFKRIARTFKRLTEKFSDAWYFLRDVVYFIKTRHDYRECWSLDDHFINDLAFNLPLIKKFKCGVPTLFYGKAARILHKDEKDFDEKKYLDANPQLDEKGLEELANKIFDEELDKCILYVNLYKYYSNYGIVDKKNPEEVAFDKKWAKTIPYIPGTYKKIDFTKLDQLTKNNWNALMNWCKENLQCCWT